MDTAQLSRVDALKLTAFSGTLPQLQALSPSALSLRSLTLVVPILVRDKTTMALFSVLKDLTLLTELNISFMLDSPYNSSSVFRALVSSCPHLQHLQLSCIGTPSFQLEPLAKALSSLRRLRALSVTLVSTGDLTLSAAGVHVARANPRLTLFTLAFMPPCHPDRTLYPFRRIKTASATFTPVLNAHGFPVALRVHESSWTLWPYGPGTEPRLRRYVLDLRPPQRGVWGILLENSIAGREMRVLVVCVLLFCLAVVFATKGK